METKGEINISPQYSREDYHNLNLSLSSDDSTWTLAVNILKDRIKGRYINQIDMLASDINANGFTIMALNCLLIEALYQFENGLKETTGSNTTSYANFLRKIDSTAFFNDAIAKDFYTNIRCGILHSAQTKAESRLTDREGFVIVVENNVLIVSVKGVVDLVKSYFDSYCAKLLNPSEVKLRENFIKKMTYICRR